MSDTSTTSRETAPATGGFGVKQQVDPEWFPPASEWSKESPPDWVLYTLLDASSAVLGYVVAVNVAGTGPAPTSAGMTEKTFDYEALSEYWVIDPGDITNVASITASAGAWGEGTLRLPSLPANVTTWYKMDTAAPWTDSDAPTDTLLFGGASLPGTDAQVAVFAFRVETTTTDKLPKWRWYQGLSSNTTLDFAMAGPTTTQSTTWSTFSRSWSAASEPDITSWRFTKGRALTSGSL